ncbi:sulfotransferase family protein [Nocardioides ferulae]|uniref:sulfotransferase family protein n=1 Tax=Nocardioides ferulae TaxID=2340821 RepID=UPI000EAF296B|nr:sulfotransferase [Nocardioides ferulae]
MTAPATAPTAPAALTVSRASGRRLDPAPVRLAKALLPQRVKDAADAVIRALTGATARWRPGPDLLVVGTKRGGTTYLWSALQAHPQVMAMVPRARHLKSSHYFTEQFRRGERWYLGHFPTRWARRRHARRHGRALCVEASPLYLFDPRVPARVAAALPQVRVVVLLRDPVHRAFSHYRERVKNGVEGLSFADALAAEPGRLGGELARMAEDPAYSSRPRDWYSYRARGEYADQLRGWFEALGRDRVLVLRSEDLYADPAAVLARVQEFAGLDPAPPAPGKRNRSDGDERIDPDSAARLRSWFAPHNQRLAELLDEEVWWP